MRLHQLYPGRTAGALATLAAVVTLGACASARQARVPVIGTAEDVSPLVGEWWGEYSGVRSGSIQFTLKAAGDSATGDVVMVPAGAQRALSPAHAEGIGAAADVSQLPQPLTISFVRVNGSTVSGRLAPYEDPYCRCTITTTFEGTLYGDRIEGSYRTSSGQQGKWKVVRGQS